MSREIDPMVLKQAESELGIFIIRAREGFSAAHPKGRDLPHEYNVSNGGTDSFTGSVNALKRRLAGMRWDMSVLEWMNPNELYVKITRMPGRAR